MHVRPSIGVTFRPHMPPEGLPAFAAEMERLGYDEVWVVEDCFFAGGIALAATALDATSKLRIGIGLLPAAVRNPAVAAMELATLSRLHPGRLRVAFGHGVEGWMRQIGARPRDRVTTLAETLQVVSDLLSGRRVTVRGESVSMTEVVLDHPPGVRPPLLVGTTGRRGLDLAARMADGILLPQGATADAVSWARQLVTAGNPTSVTVVYAWLSIEDDPAAARASLRPEVERWREIGRYPELARRLPSSPDAPEGPAADDTIDAMAIVGDPGDCAGGVRRLADAGADAVVLRPRVQDGRAQLVRFAREVLPLLEPPPGFGPRL